MWDLRLAWHRPYAAAPALPSARSGRDGRGKRAWPSGFSARVSAVRGAARPVDALRTRAAAWRRRATPRDSSQRFATGSAHDPRVALVDARLASESVSGAE